MKVKFYQLMLIASCSLGVGCAGVTGPLPTEHSSINTKEQQATTSAAVRRGRILTVTECAQCHRLYRPNEFPSEQWPDIVRKMGRRASLNEEQIKDIITYYAASGAK